MSQRGSITQTELLKERFHWDNKFFTIYTDFRPNLKATNVTPKFYARHEGSESFENVDSNTLQLIFDYHEKGPRERTDYPETENQRYGWYQDLLIPMEKNDKRINSHRIGTADIKLAAGIKTHLIKEPPFTGVPFKL